MKPLRDALFDRWKKPLNPGGVLPEKLGGGVWCTSQNPYLLKIKICYIPYLIYDLTKKLQPYLWPDPYIKILFQTNIIISPLVQANDKLP